MSFWGSTSVFPNGATAALLRPVIALNVWTFVMEVWMYRVRLAAASTHKVKITRYMRIEEINAQMPAEVRWKADNYNHLMEQPTQFYAVAIALTLLDPGNDTNAVLAWAYVGTRVVHSLWHATINNIMVRFGLFTASSAVLAAMTYRAAVLLL